MVTSCHRYRSPSQSDPSMSTNNHRLQVMACRLPALVALLIALSSYMMIQIAMQRRPPRRARRRRHGTDMDAFLLPNGTRDGKIASVFIEKAMNNDVDLATTGRTPKIVWLMSYPNSGTSYTMTLVERASNFATASNYGVEVTAPGDSSTPVDIAYQGGPFWDGISGKLGTIRSLPQTFILTKTHCSGRCVNCDAQEFVVSRKSFLVGCARTTYRSKLVKRRLESKMDPARVAKLVHLIRSPFDNIVARYHLERRHWIEKNASVASQWTHNATGFATWCKYLDRQYSAQDENFFDENMRKLLSTIPCHGEFFKYIQWHNHARAIAENLGNIPTLTLFYEEYQKNLNTSLESLLTFLDLPLQGVVRPFRDLPDYSDHFTTSDRAAVKKIFDRSASREVLPLLGRYFE